MPVPIYATFVTCDKMDIFQISDIHNRKILQYIPLPILWLQVPLYVVFDDLSYSSSIIFDHNIDLHDDHCQSCSAPFKTTTLVWIEPLALVTSQTPVGMSI